MDKLLTYLMQVGLASGLLYLGYLLTRQHTSPKIKRFILLACLLLPVTASFLDFHYSATIPTAQDSMINQAFSHYKAPSSIAVQSINDQADSQSSNEGKSNLATELQDHPKVSSNTNVNAAITCYLLIVALGLIRLLISFISVNSLRLKATWNDQLKVYMVDQQGFTGASFFHFIFVSKYLTGHDLLETVIHHERQHVRHRHSFDLILSELLCCFYWYNPIFWILKREIKLNHEYEVDLNLSQSISVQHYAKTLLAITTSKHTSPMAMMNNFSFHSTKKRILNLKKPIQTNNRSIHYFLPFVLLSLCIASCNLDVSQSVSDIPYTGQPIKTITTTFVSHQKDTKTKDMKTVAVANFLPDGRLDEVIQHMTYPYNYEYPKKVSLWGATDVASVPVILDGLTLGKAEYNFLYGNDWPVKYVDQLVDSKLSQLEGSAPVKDISMFNSTLPETITTHNINNDRTHTENFTYQGQMISSYHSFYEVDHSLIKRYNRGGRLPKKSVYSLGAHSFHYQEDLLTQVTDGQVTYQFQYDGNRLTSAQYYNHGTCYNTRKYYYNDSGLKERTDIFNVHGDAEYSIFYHYEFY